MRVKEWEGREKEEVKGRNEKGGNKEEVKHAFVERAWKERRRSRSAGKEEDESWTGSWGAQISNL